MQTYYNILDTIRRQLLQDKFVNTVTNGDIFDVDLEKKTIYPLSHVMVNQATRKDKVYTLNMTILLMDIVDKVSHEAQDVFKGNDNEQDVFNTQLAVGARLVEMLKRGDLRDNNFELSSDPNFEPFTERFENSLAGWALTFDVDMPNDMTICDADIIPSDCAAANYSIKDEDGNVLYSGTIESGLSLTQSITNSDVQNSDGSYSVGVPAQGNLTLPDETILVVNTNMDIIASDPNRPSVKDGSIEVPNVDNIDSDGSTVSTPAGVPFTCTPVTPSAGDYDYEKFKDATGITDTTILSAVETLVDDLKTNNLWNKFSVIYPFVGGTADTHKYNLKDARDLDEAFRMVFNGTWSHDSNGAVSDGVTAYGDTNYNPLYNSTVYNEHLSGYIQNTLSGAIIGATQNPTDQILQSGGTLFSSSSGGNLSGAVTANNGHYLLNRTNNADCQTYIDGVEVLNLTLGITGYGNQDRNYYMAARNNSGFAGFFCANTFSFLTIGKGLTVVEVGVLTTIVNTFQTSLSRNV